MLLSRAAAVYVTVLGLISGFGLFGFICTVHVSKSNVGINIFEGASFLHPLYVAFLAR